MKAALSQWSHAGGVVVRTKNGGPQYLLVEAKNNPGMWVLPKGHIERGETPEAAAVREVEEEAGVRATIVARAGESEFEVKGRTVRTIFFLMQYEEDTARIEERGVAWRRYKDALSMVAFDNTRQILMQAHALNN
jgi:8-oxo-dGTP pyrophosphatase MutT (NUDIX family)